MTELITGVDLVEQMIRVAAGEKLTLQQDDVKLNGWSADNVTFGMGGGLLQKLNRDTQQFAFKCAEVVVKGVARDVWKDPVTDPGKVSKRGRLALQRNADGVLETLPEGDARTNELIDVFLDGEVLDRPTFDEIRERAA